MADAIWERLTESQEREYNRLDDICHAYGYFISSEPIPGQEALWLESLKEGVNVILEAAPAISRVYKTRGRSKRAIEIMHLYHEQPAWGITIRPSPPNH